MKLCATAVALLFCTAAGCAVNPANELLHPDDAASNAPAGISADSAEEALSFGNRYLAGAEFDKAMMYYALALEKDPRLADACYKIGVIHEMRGHNELAAKAYRQAMLRDSAHAGALERQGILLLQARKYDDAATYLQRAVDVEPKRLRAHNGLGVIADLNRDHAVAAVHFQAVLDQAPASVATLVNLGYSRYLAGAWPEAEKRYRQALTHDPENVKALQNLGLLYARLGRYEDALELLGRVMSTADAHNDVGYVCMQDGKHAEAARFFADAIRLSPSYNDKAQKNLVLNRKRLQQAPRSAPMMPQPARVATLPPITPAASPERDARAESKPLLTSIVAPAPAEPVSILAPQSVETSAQPSLGSGATAASGVYSRRWVSASVLQVRKQANTGAEVLDRLHRGRVVRIMQTDEEWVYVKYWLYSAGNVLEKAGWVHGDYLTDSRYSQDS